MPDLMRRFGASQCQACAALLRMSMSVYLYRSCARDAAPLRMRIKEIAGVRVHYGYRRVHVLLRREGWKDNHKRVYWLYRADGLSLRHKRPRRNKAARLRQPKVSVKAMNELWSMDFVGDALFEGGRPRAITVLENYSSECLAIDLGQSLKGEDVVRTLDRIKVEHGLPRTIKVDNGSELISKAMDRWAYENGVELDLSRPGRPIDNAKIESFNGRLRQECLIAHWFLSLTDAQRKIEASRQYYNEARLHSAIGWLAPAEFARQRGACPVLTGNKEPEISTVERY